MLPDFNRLKVFYYIFRHQSVAAAAQQLHVTQSAVSQTLIKLEEELKTHLFTRMHKQLVPTTEAEDLYGVIEPFMEKLETTIEGIQKTRSTPGGVLKIGAPVEFGENYVIDACSQFHEQYSDVDFHLELGHPDKLLPLLKAGKLDLAFADIFAHQGGYQREYAQFSIEPVFDETLVLACSKSYQLAAAIITNDLKSILNSNFIAYQQHAPSVRSWLKHHFNKESANFRTLLSVESVRGVIKCIRQGLGLGIVPRYLVQKEIQTGEIVVIETVQEELVNKISLVRLLDKIPRLTEKLFLESFIRLTQPPKL